MSAVPVRGGTPSGGGVTFRGPFSRPDPHRALALDRGDRLRVVWPGPSVRVFRKGRAWWAQALDAGGAVPHAGFRTRRRTLDASGRAKVPRRRGTARAAGHVFASFRVP